MNESRPERSEKDTAPEGPPSAAKVPPSALAAWPLVVPLALFVLATNGEARLVAAWGTPAYPWVYLGKILAVTLVTLVCLPAWRGYSWRLSPWGIGAGVLGAALWIGLCELRLESQILNRLPPNLQAWLAGGDRVGFNPWQQLGDSPLELALFLATRFFGLVLLVPLIEEVFVRAFLVPLMEDPDWRTLEVGQAGPLALAAAAVYGAATHPGEWLAAVVWFTLISVLARRTRSLGECVLAHAVTNLALGVYVLAYGRWELW